MMNASFLHTSNPSRKKRNTDRQHTGKIHREIVYTVASLDREKAIEVAHKLRAVEDAELAPLAN